VGHDGGGELRWLLTYSDVVTLLLALFIYLYSISSINTAKYNAFAQSLQQVFGMGKVPASYNSQSGGDGVLPQATALVYIQQKLMSQLQEAIERGEVSVKATEEGLVLSLKDQVLFGMGKADLMPAAEPMIAGIAKLLKGEPNKIRIEGHTDNVPIVKGGRYDSNWELSAARAASVVKFMIEKCGIDPSLLQLAGYAEYKPVAPNMPRVGNPMNRRVEIVIVKEVSLKTAVEANDAKSKEATAPPETGEEGSGEPVLVPETELPPPEESKYQNRRTRRDELP
jgi:chemotaxis protein MotB